MTYEITLKEYEEMFTEEFMKENGLTEDDYEEEYIIDNGKYLGQIVYIRPWREWYKTYEICDYWKEWNATH